MKRIKLTQGKYTIVDDQDYERLSKYEYILAKSKKDKYYALVKIDGSKIYLHRFIMGAEKGQIVDHENGDGLDNQRSNLRACTYSQNNANRKSYGSSQYLGVCLRKSRIYTSQLCINGKIKHLGTFKTEIEAAIIWNLTARRYYGEYTNLNTFPIR